MLPFLILWTVSCNAQTEVLLLYSASAFLIHVFFPFNMLLWDIGRHEEDTSGKKVEMSNRREALLSSVGSIACCLLSATSFTAVPPAAVAAASSSEFADS